MLKLFALAWIVASALGYRDLTEIEKDEVFTNYLVILNK